jgi:transcriptional regulator with XRE-family HTH domain
MQDSIMYSLGTQLKEARVKRGLTQPALASRLGRNRARISELERELLNERIGRDRLALLVEICDALDLSVLLVPSTRLKALQDAMSPGQKRTTAPAPQSTAFDDVFIDLSDEDDD